MKTKNTSLVITGRVIGRRFEVVVNGQSVPLTGTGFLYLFRLARRAALGNGNGRTPLGSDANDARYIHRLKEELEEAGVADFLPIHWERGYSYRLGLAPNQIRFDHATLKEYPDHRVKQMLMTNGCVVDAGATVH
jgi:hypothetical protein